MNKATKRITAALLATMLLGGAQMMAFASVESSEEGTDTVTVTSEPASEASTESATEGATNTAGNINQSPNTGVSVAPFAVAILAAASVPVILKTRK